MARKHEPSLPATAARNIEAIAKVEKALLRKRTVPERMGEYVARFFGSLFFIAAHIAFFAAWMVVNTYSLTGLTHFDPYPFPFLSLAIGIEFILLTTFVLLNQKYQIRREEQWSHLHLQLSMLTEAEVTRNVQMLLAISRKLGIDEIAADDELSEMAKPTSVTAFVERIEKSGDAGLAKEEGVLEMEKKTTQSPEREDDG